MVKPSPSQSNDPLSGYFGHLTREQQKALDELKTLLVNDGIQLGESLVDESYGNRQHGVSDLELLRFLRARKFDIHKAYDMYKAALSWRHSVDLDNLYATFDWPTARRASRAGYLQYFHKHDKSHSPIHIHELHTLNLNKLFQIISPEDQVRYMFLLNESNFRERFPGCTKEMRRNKQGDEIRKTREEKTEREEVADDTLGEIETVTGILDIKNVGLMGFWKVKDMLGRVIHISDNYYPETSNRMASVTSVFKKTRPHASLLQFIINAPAMFSTVWAYVRPWLDARTASRRYSAQTTNRPYWNTSQRRICLYFMGEAVHAKTLREVAGAGT
ncbi:MAG: cytosolic factor, phosphatidylinositol/phosphatidylcholine transfer protein [Cyphobasidiales sp. Tagirdzhanova-0007]|nr:MAG: cytosolic factor, phosphatidylinositol/phosphatidylcholine transfer protein [Cyphobasidiales sp. Tagirdzhanova-0007]